MMNRALRKFARLPVAFALLAGLAAAEGFRARTVLDFVAPSDTLPMQLPTAVAIGPAGDVYVLDGVNNRVLVFQPDGRLQFAISPAGEAALSQPVGLRIATDGRLWIADSGNGRVVVCAPDGTLKQLLTLPA